MEGTCFFDDFPLNWKYKYDQPLSETHFRRSGTQFRFCGVLHKRPLKRLQFHQKFLLGKLML